MGYFPQVGLSVLPLSGSLQPTPGYREKGPVCGSHLVVFRTPDPMPFLVPGNSGKPDNLFLLEARHFAARVSSKIGKSGDFGAAGWSQEAVGFHGAADERGALDRSQQLALLTRTEGRAQRAPL